MSYSIEAIIIILLGFAGLFRYGYFDNIKYSFVFLFFSMLYVFLGLVFGGKSYSTIDFYCYLYFCLFVTYIFCLFDSKITTNKNYFLFSSKFSKSLFVLAFYLLIFYLFLGVLEVGLDSAQNLETERLVLVQDKKLIFYGLIVIAPYLLAIILHEIGIFLWFPACILLCVLVYLTGFRSPLLNIIFISGLYVALSKPSFIRDKIKLIICVGIVLFGTALFLTIVRTGLPPAEAIVILLDRLLTLNLRNIDNIMQFHQDFDYLYGKSLLMDSWPLLGRALSFLGADRGSTYAEFMTLELNPRSPFSFVMTPTFFGIAYADLPYVGLVIHFLIFGLSIICMRKIVRYMPLQAAYIYFFGIAATRGLFTTFIIFFIPILVVHLVISFFINIGKEYARRTRKI